MLSAANCEGVHISSNSNIRAEMGLGQSCRLIANMILKCNCGLSIYNTDTNGNIKKGDASFDEYISLSNYQFLSLKFYF
mgnify:CR=1 FL=1